MDSSLEDGRPVRFPMRFAPKGEEAFQKYYWREALPQVRLAFALTLILVVCFGGLDALLLSGSELRAVWLIRYTYCTPIVALGLFFSLRPNFLRHGHKILIAVCLAGGIGMSAMTAVVSGPERTWYIIAVAQTLVMIYTLTRLPFRSSSVVGLGIMVSYAIFALRFERIPIPLLINNILSLGVFNAIGISASYMLENATRRDYQQQCLLQEKNEEIAKQQQLAESLLFNALPERIAEELKSKGAVEPRYHDSVTILFTDFKGFTLSAESLSADELVSKLNDYFTAFDNICDRYHLEKLKTIGDSYMCVGGLSSDSASHAVDTLMAGFEMIEAVKARADGPGTGWSIRIGLHTGPVVSGIIGIRRFAFDIWGESVNFASRLETSGFPNRVNLSASSFTRVKDFFECEYRGKIATKEGREFDMYFALAALPVLREDNCANGVPEAFAARYQRYFHRKLMAFPASLLH
jgi:class 3 adenylate cyclase